MEAKETIAMDKIPKGGLLDTAKRGLERTFK